MEIRATKRQSRDGKHVIELGAKVSLGNAWYTAWIDGREHSSTRGMDLADNKGEGIGGSIGNVAVLTTEIDALQGAYAKMEQLAMETPEYLRRRRADLVLSLNSAYAEEQESRVYDWEHGIGFRPHPGIKTMISEREAALETFDAAHPEIKVALKTERKERAESHIWD